MAITFPANPSLNDTFTSGGKTFQWNGTSWTVNQEANILTDTTPQLGGNLDLNSQDITGTGDINVTGTVTATSFSGDGSSLTGAGTTTTAEWTLVLMVLITIPLLVLVLLLEQQTNDLFD